MQHAYLAALALEPVPPEPVAVGAKLLPRLSVPLRAISQRALPIYHGMTCKQNTFVTHPARPVPECSFCNVSCDSAEFTKSDTELSSARCGANKYDILKGVRGVRHTCLQQQPLPFLDPVLTGFMLECVYYVVHTQKQMTNRH